MKVLPYLYYEYYPTVTEWAGLGFRVGAVPKILESLGSSRSPGCWLQQLRDFDIRLPVASFALVNVPGPPKVFGYIRG